MLPKRDESESSPSTSAMPPPSSKSPAPGQSIGGGRVLVDPGRDVVVEIVVGLADPVHAAQQRASTDRRSLPGADLMPRSL
jgi:hypothetical protein